MNKPIVSFEEFIVLDNLAFPYYFFSIVTVHQPNYMYM